MSAAQPQPRPKEQLPLPFARSSPTALAVYVPDPFTQAAELQKLRREGQKLLGQVQRRQSSLKFAEDVATQADRAFQEKLCKLQEKLAAFRDRIKKTLTELASKGSRLNSRERTQIRELRDQMFQQDEDEDVFGPFGADPDEGWEDFGFAEEGFPSESASHSGRGSNGGYEVPSAPQVAGETGTLRTLFRGLAAALHPDRVKNESEKRQRTDVLKQVTVAYQKGDIASLLQLEQTWLNGAAPGSTQNGAQKQRLRNKELKAQLRRLTAELNYLSDTYPGAMPARRKPQPPDPHGQLLKELRTALKDATEHQKLVFDFRDNKLSFAEFLLFHCEPEDPLDDFESSDILSQLIEAFVAQQVVDMEKKRAPPRKKPKRNQAQRSKR